MIKLIALLIGWILPLLYVLNLVGRGGLILGIVIGGVGIVLVLTGK